jgi:ADP-ribosylarginine hydrolase
LGVDSVIIAYDALLSSLDYCNKKGKLGIKINRWEQVCLRGVLHGGDNDSTGTIVGAWYGALFGFEEVFECNYINSEKREYIEQLGEKIYKKVYRAKLELGKEK